MDMPRRPLGSSELEVSRLSLGSWRTFERISKDAGLEVMRAAREAGINFLDDARYNDETGKAPIPTGYSEVLFGELFRAAGWQRDETIVCNKLWWEFWPDQSAAEELDGSLGRMGLDHIDVIYANVPPDGLPLEQMVHDVAGLIAAGKARAWAIVNWPADQLLALSRAARREDVPQPICAQLAYSLVHRSPVEDDDMRTALEACGAPVVASYVLAGGVLSGKYDARPRGGPGRGRARPADVRRRRDRRPFARSARRATRDDSGRACRGLRAAEPRRRDGALRCDQAGADRAERRCARARGAPHRCRPCRAHCDRDLSVSGRRPDHGSAASP